jgi:hypothetical protein
MVTEGQPCMHACTHTHTHQGATKQVKGKGHKQRLLTKHASREPRLPMISSGMGLEHGVGVVGGVGWGRAGHRQDNVRFKHLLTEKCTHTRGASTLTNTPSGFPVWVSARFPGWAITCHPNVKARRTQPCKTQRQRQHSHRNGHCCCKREQPARSLPLAELQLANIRSR